MCSRSEAVQIEPGVVERLQREGGLGDQSGQQMLGADALLEASLAGAGGGLGDHGSHRLGARGGLGVVVEQVVSARPGVVQGGDAQGLAGVFGAQAELFDQLRGAGFRLVDEGGDEVSRFDRRGPSRAGPLRGPFQRAAGARRQRFVHHVFDPRGPAGRRGVELLIDVP